MDNQSSGRRRTAVVVAVAGLLLVVIVLVRLSGGAGNAVESLPTVDLAGPDDIIVSTAQLVGEPLVINFWYAACPPCANELQYFGDVHAEYGDRVRFVGVNAIDTIEEMTEFAGERGVDYELLRDPLGELQTEMRLTSFPTTLFVDVDGTVVERTGVVDRAGLEAEIVELLAGQ